ncbi:MAG: DUF362 domain-containing protein [Candidatus Aminicenantes bacterium]|nr:DUF362 domain-containing protein [Candidatus Aminicenantes bacterium]
MSKKINRRDFIKKSASMGALSFLGWGVTSSCTSQQTAMKEQAGAVDIAVVQGQDYALNTTNAVDHLGGMDAFVSSGDKVAILANPQRNNPGAFTKPDLLQATIQMCNQAGAQSVTCISQLPDQNWEATGLKKVVSDQGAGLVIVDRSDDSQFKTVSIPKGTALREAQIMNEFYNYDVLIDMPITKDHAGNKFTGTMKNLMGLSSGKTNRSFHKKGWQTDINAIDHLEQCIADLNTIIQPDLCIVDATEFITTNGPFGPGEIITPQKVVAGTDRVAVDSYCCTLWGLQGKDILQITKAFNLGVGEMDLSKVRIKEVSV